ncbi:uncharacterized protein MYCFIDRAFT_87509 [Pseudocercospora fijiensis CIRAD86]|uniref:Zn(2)-C6 fungal-type domain-containing protein n=1 Tax=Pseudocercospora fijiensis (strain CIRAD86) TaxID=383855 RepID=M3A804_PSEFD|nr:uncharacterized protein MYCFIDRAFT_87509 [Pseudocercospora fijiensis CIRAD86]EME80736.1 hypothetical protein MYCFIDRAFT_87509 [Pseudocercospora fijiensis CIRAD86]
MSNSEVEKQINMAGSAAVACVACRRLKMRCIGLESGCCDRCAKAKRECTVLPSRRGCQQRRSSARQRHGAVSSRVNGTPHHASSATSINSNNGRHASSSSIGLSRADSGHTASRTTGMLLVIGSPGRSPSKSHAPQSHEISYSKDTNLRKQSSDVLSDSALESLVRFFSQGLIYFVPILEITDLDDVPFLMTHCRPLVYCAALIAAKFAPGAGHLYDQIVPYVHHFLRSLEGPLAQDEEVIWMQLQAYAILYANGTAADISHPKPETEDTRRLNHWVLKASIETFALRLSLHQSFSEVRRLVQDGALHIDQTFAFRKYVYWLWLFTLSHHFSLVTESPPSIRADYSIRTACFLLSQVEKPGRITRMLAEVDLCMLWNAAGQSLPGLDEWWCPPPQDQDPEQASRVLDDADAALDVWSQRWGVHGEPNATYPGLDVNNNGVVLFHYLATRFWLRVFSIRVIRSSRLTANSAFPQNQSLRQLNVSLTLKSAEAAEKMCRCVLEIPVHMRDSAKHMADFGFALVAFCGIYILRIYELFGAAFPVLESHVKTVEETGRVLTEMSVGINHVPIIYGKRVLERLEEVKRSLAMQVVDPSLGMRTAQDVDLRWIDGFFARV